MIKSGALLLLLFLAAAPALYAQAPSSPPPPAALPYTQEQLSYYVHVIRGHPSLGLLLPPINTTFSNNLGVTTIFDLNMTVAESNTSRFLGYARGYTVDTSYTDAYAGFETEVLSYDDGIYNGTIYFQAMLDGSNPAEVAVLGGTGSFRGVRGWGLISQVVNQPPVIVYLHTLYFMSCK